MGAHPGPTGPGAYHRRQRIGGQPPLSPGIHCESAQLLVLGPQPKQAAVGGHPQRVVGGVFGQVMHIESVQRPVGALVGVAAQRLAIVANLKQARSSTGPQPPGLVAEQREGADGAVGLTGPRGGGAVGQLADQAGD